LNTNIEVPIFSKGELIFYEKCPKENVSLEKSDYLEIILHFLLQCIISKPRSLPLSSLKDKKYLSSEIQSNLPEIIAYSYSLIWQDFPKKLKIGDLYASLKQSFPFVNEESFHVNLLKSIQPLFEYFDSFELEKEEKLNYWQFIVQENSICLNLLDQEFPIDSVLGIFKFLIRCLLNSNNNSYSSLITATLTFAQKFKIQPFTLKAAKNSITCTAQTPQPFPIHLNDSINEFLP
jgi:hypothetical protein